MDQSQKDRILAGWNHSYCRAWEARDKNHAYTVSLNSNEDAPLELFVSKEPTETRQKKGGLTMNAWSHICVALTPEQAKEMGKALLNWSAAMA